MTVKQTIEWLQGFPHQDYQLRFREGTMAHNNVAWGEVIEGNSSINAERKIIVIYTEPFHDGNSTLK